MSSYQFVNTLAQCYAATSSALDPTVVGQQHQQQPPQDQQAAAAASMAAAAAAAAAAGGTSSAAADYYNMNYPNCYSPSNLSAQYGQYQAAAAGLMGMGNGAAVGQVGQSGGSSAAGAAAVAAAAAASQLQQSTGDYSSSSGQRNSANQSPVSTNNMLNQNCKFSSSTPVATATAPTGGAVPGVSAADVSLGSPQDLSRSSDGDGPMGGSRGNRNSDDDNDDMTPPPPSSSQQQHQMQLMQHHYPSSSAGGGGGGASTAAEGAGGKTQHQTSPAAAAAKESSSSTSTASGSGTSAEKGKSSSSAKSSDKSSSSSSSSPQIYPWMKRVHLGQSKLLKANNRGFVSRERGEGRGLSKSKCRHSLTPLSPSVPFPFSSPLLFNPVTLSHASMRAPARKLRLPLALCFLCSLFVAFGC